MRALNFPKYSKTTDYSIKPVLPMRSTEVDEDASYFRDLKGTLVVNTYQKDIFNTNFVSLLHFLCTACNEI